MRVVNTVSSPLIRVQAGPPAGRAEALQKCQAQIQTQAQIQPPGAGCWGAVWLDRLYYSLRNHWGIHPNSSIQTLHSLYLDIWSLRVSMQCMFQGHLGFSSSCVSGFSQWLFFTPKIRNREIQRIPGQRCYRRLQRTRQRLSLWLAVGALRTTVSRPPRQPPRHTRMVGRRQSELLSCACYKATPAPSNGWFLDTS